jgi:hypothetical protein
MEALAEKLSSYLALLRDNRDLVIMFAGAAAAIYVYNDFRDVVQAQAETAAKTAEILRVMQNDLATLRADVTNLQTHSN